METGPVLADRLGILRHATIECRLGVVVFKIDSVKITGSQTTAAAYTVGIIHTHFPGLFIKYQSAVRTFLLTAHAAPALFLTDFRFAAGVLLLLPRP